MCFGVYQTDRKSRRKSFFFSKNIPKYSSSRSGVYIEPSRVYIYKIPLRIYPYMDLNDCVCVCNNDFTNNKEKKKTSPLPSNAIIFRVYIWRMTSFIFREASSFAFPDQRRLQDIHLKREGLGYLIRRSRWRYTNPETGCRLRSHAKRSNAGQARR